MDYYKEGEQFYLNNEYMKALKCFKLNYDNGYSNDTLNYIACCYINLGNFIEAKKTLMELIMRTNWERPLFNLGRVYLMEEDYSNAEKYFKLALEKNYQNCDCHFYMGLYYDRKGDINHAIEYYNNSLQLENCQPETHLNIGICYYKIHLYQQAIKHFLISYEQDDTLVEARYYHAISLITIRKYNEALQILFELENAKYNIVNLKNDIEYCMNKINKI